MVRTHEINKVLVVDDEVSMCTLLENFLRQQGYGPHCTTDPVQALEMLDRDSFEVMISDIRMPGMNGMDLTRSARLRCADISVIIMTGFAGDYSYSDIINAGAADFIRKPVELQELKAKLERIDLERKTLRELRELNTALRVVLKAKEEDRNQLCASVAANTKQLILPYVDKLRATRLNQVQQMYLDLLESNIKEISSPLITSLSQKHPDLTPMEIQVAGLIKSGKRNKEIAELLGISINTVMTHRHHLRKKLDLQKGSTSLMSYLHSMEI